MRRVVLDTNVIVAGFRSRNGASHLLLECVARRQLVLLATAPLFLEYEDVLKRPEHLAATGLTIGAVDRRLRALADAVEAVAVHFAWRPLLTDADDEMVLEAAVNGRAEALITFNARHFVVAASRFGVRVLRPAEALMELA